MVFFKDFAKFTEKHLCQSLCFNKVADLQEGILCPAQVFSWKNCKIFKNRSFIEHLRATTSTFEKAIKTKRNKKSDIRECLYRWIHIDRCDRLSHLENTLFNLLLGHSFVSDSVYISTYEQ